jgi:hypothetical protein
MADNDLYLAAKTYGSDLLERVTVTFLQGFAGAFVITQPLDASMWYAAGAAGVAASLSLLKGLVAKLRGDSDSASLSRKV